jgi:hypothetical protein
LKECEWWGTAGNMPVAADEEKFLWGWNTCCCLKVEEDCWKRWKLYWRTLCLQQCTSENLWKCDISNIQMAWSERKALISNTHMIVQFCWRCIDGDINISLVSSALNYVIMCKSY